MERVSVVTGGGSGIGKAIAKMLGKETTVVITGRTKEKLEGCVTELKAQGCKVIAYACDVSNRESVKKLAAYCASLGEIVKVVHAAGVSGTVAHKAFPLCVTDEEKFVKKMVSRSKILHNEEINPQFAYMGSKRFAIWYAKKCAFKYMRTKGIRVFLCQCHKRKRLAGM